MKDTFFQICVTICILLVIFNVLIVFVNALNIYGGEVEAGVDVEEGDTADNVFKKMLPNLSGGVAAVWTTILTVSGIASIAVAILMHSATPVGVWIFSSVFWSSYTGMIGVVNVNNIFTTEPMIYLLLAFTVGLIFVWMGALAGMFSGSG